MIAVLQRIHRASVSADGEYSGSCGKGLLILLGVGQNDTEEDARLLAEKIVNLRIFTDENGKMNLSVSSIGGEAMVVSNFTLLADYSHGHRPDYFGAARPEQAIPLYEHFVKLLSDKLSHVATGRFGSHMEVETVTDGPVTIVMDSERLRRGRSK